MAKQHDPFATLMRLAQHQQGYFTTKQAIQAGHADTTHSYHVRAGNWERAWRGVYRMRPLPTPEDGDMMLWQLWSRGRDEKPVAAVSHQSALSMFELGDFNPAKIHLIVPPTFRRNSRLPKGVTLHRAKLDPEEITHLRGIRVCRPLRGMCDVAEADPNAIEELKPAAREARDPGLMPGREIFVAKATPSTRAVMTRLLP